MAESSGKDKAASSGAEGPSGPNDEGFEGAGYVIQSGKKGWWEGDGRAEHLLDVALPHEDHEESVEPGFQPGPGAIAAGIALLATFVTLFALVFVYAVEAWF